MQTRSAKIAHLTSVHAPNDTRIVHKECTALAKAGYDVVVIAPGPQVWPEDGVRHRSVPRPRNRFERFTRTIAAVYRAACDERAAVYHFHDPELIGVGMALRLRGASVIFDVHEDIPQDIKSKPWIPSSLRPLLSMLASGFLRCVQGCFTAIVPATPSIARSFKHRRTIVVHNYPELADLERDEADVPFERRPNTALYLGSISLLRGVEQMVRAMADTRLPDDARLLLAGEFEDERLRARVCELPGWSRVDAPGMLSRKAVATALSTARVGLLPLLPAPNHEYAMPQKLFEYLGAGLPVIVSNALLAYRDIVERHACGILIDPRDSSEISSAVLYLLSHPDEARAMGERGRAAVRERYQWKTQARHLTDLYAAVVS